MAAIVPFPSFVVVRRRDRSTVDEYIHTIIYLRIKQMFGLQSDSNSPTRRGAGQPADVRTAR